MKTKHLPATIRLKSESVIDNENGQTSIFVALIFQVLFVLFAMALNIGMVVHDKINLQNSTDLAAYYAASKQAEWLNVIAHTNYQIRQAFKLAAFRYKVMGTMGMDGRFNTARHPSYDDINFSETNWAFANFPYACISFIKNWNVVGTDDNFCRIRDVPIPNLPQVAIIAGFNPINAAIAALTASIQSSLDQRCEVAGAYSWYWAAAAAQSFREDQKNRMDLIEAYAANLARTDPVDIDGQPISVGAKKTLDKNLTSGNFTSGASFEIFNSLEGKERREWLSKVRIMPYVRYIDVILSPGCTGKQKPIENRPAGNGQNIVFNTLQAQDLWFAIDNLNIFQPDAGSYQFSLGVEKNPWMVAYMGVKAEVNSRPIFFPFGDGVRLVAESYAKPFGGRVGPWYYDQWAPGSDYSEPGMRVDQKVPFRVNVSGSSFMTGDVDRIPDYSKYPGDTLGLTTHLAQNSLVGLDQVKNQIQWYQDIWKPVNPSVPRTWDKLSWDFSVDQAPPSRMFEIAAVSPDLFDITYYSIEPEFSFVYRNRIEAARNAIGIPESVVIRGDLGYRPQQAENFSVKNQIEIARNGMGASPAPPQRDQAFYYVKDQGHLLTSWIGGPNYGRDGNYDVVPEVFGRCGAKNENNQLPVAGDCLSDGGNTGYAVKLVNKEALLSGDWELGGTGNKGPIRNPPSW